MAEQTYVEVSKFTADGTAPAAYKSKSIETMGKVAKAAVKASSKLTDDAPKDKKTKGWYLFGNLDSLGPDKAGKKFEAKVSVTIGTWPARSLKSFPNGKGAFAIASADEKVSPGDADQLVVTATKEAMKTGIAWMEKNKPE